MLSKLEHQLIESLHQNLHTKPVTPEAACVLRVLDTWKQEGIRAAAELILATHIDDCRLCTGADSDRLCAKCIEFQFQGGLKFLDRLHTYFFTLGINIVSTRIVHGNKICFAFDYNQTLEIPFPCSEFVLYQQLLGITRTIHAYKVEAAYQQMNHKVAANDRI